MNNYPDSVIKKYHNLTIKYEVGVDVYYNYTSIEYTPNNDTVTIMYNTKIHRLAKLFLDKYINSQPFGESFFVL
jgi:hypothetical protein